MDGDLVVLEPWVVDQFKQDFPTSMLLFYGKGCGSCMWMMGAYREAAKTAKEQNLPIKFGIMNGNANRPFTKNLGAKGFPHIHVFGEQVMPFGYHYTGKMEADSFMRELKQHADGTFKPKSDMTKTLTSETYNDFINQTDYVVVLYTSSKNDNPMYKFISYALHEMKAEGQDEIPVGVLNVTEHKGAALAEHSANMVMGFRKGFPYEFYGQSNVVQMKEELLRRSFIPSTELTLASVKDSNVRQAYFEGQSTEDVVVAFLRPADNKIDSEILARWNNWCFGAEQIDCAHTFDLNLAQKYKVKGYKLIWTRPDMFVYHETQPRSTQIPSVPFKTDVDFVTLWQDNMKDLFLPLVGYYDMTYYHDLSNWISNTVVVCYFNVDYGANYEETMRMMHRIETVAANYFNMTKENVGNHAPIRFAVAGEIVNADFLAKYDLSREDADDNPLIIIHNNYNHTEHLPTQEEQMENDMKFETYLESVVDSFLAGSLPAFMRAESPPKSQTYPINTVVSSTLYETMMDKSKDVVIFFNQKRGCEECKVILKWLEQIADEVKLEPLRIVQLDIFENNLNRTMFPYQKAPRLLMMPGGEKPEETIGFPWEMDMNLQRIKGFIGFNAKLSFTSCKDTTNKQSIEDLIAKPGKDNKKVDKKVEL